MKLATILVTFPGSVFTVRGQEWKAVKPFCLIHTRVYVFYCASYRLGKFNKKYALV